jgi:DNA-binding transcriptional ArsR family regulator
MIEAMALPLDELGRVLAEPTRLRILQELLGGPPLPAGALAARLGLAPSTVSAHLARLHDAGMIRVEQRGRARLAELADTDVAEAIEALLRLSTEAPVNSFTGFDRRAAMRTARSCYDHLAGRAGVAVAEVALERGWVADVNGTWALPDATGRTIADGLGVRIALAASGRPLVRPCADWTERRPHLAGRLGRAILEGIIAEGWVRRRREDRALTITSVGRERFGALGAAGF